jgi:hypothetical protein
MSEQQQLRHLSKGTSKGTAPRGVTRLCQLRSAYELLPGNSIEMSSSGRNTGASQRASEINNAMLNVPGYADDSMLFMLRYGALAKVCYDLICDFFFLLSLHLFVWHYHIKPHLYPPLPVSFFYSSPSS